MRKHNDNAERPKPKENQLGILKIYAFCQKIQQSASGPGDSIAEFCIYLRECIKKIATSSPLGS